MKCSKSESVASAYLDKQVTRSEAMDYRAHIKNCADCYTYMTDLNDASLMLGSMRQPDVPPGLRRHIMSAINSK